jgi:hypothetical protein
MIKVQCLSMLEKECFWKICLYEEPYFPFEPYVSGNAFLWKISQSTVVVVIGHQHILLCHQCPCRYNQNFLTSHYFLKIVDAEFLLCGILCFKKMLISYLCGITVCIMSFVVVFYNFCKSKIP